jgi:hypothetical protein
MLVDYKNVIIQSAHDESFVELTDYSQLFKVPLLEHS